jgi:hypothetical protein
MMRIADFILEKTVMGLTLSILDFCLSVYEYFDIAKLAPYIVFPVFICLLLLIL